MATTAIYPGSFDPVTHGHVDIIQRSLKLFDRVVVAVTQNLSKRPFLPLEERIFLLERVTEGMGPVTVVSFTGLLVDFARSVPAHIVIRGLRAVSDFELELQMALTNRAIDAELETAFLMPSGRFVFLSSGLVREIWQLGGPFEKFVPEVVADHLRRKPRGVENDGLPGWAGGGWTGGDS
ncbi:MAG: pantetheine-phosphate adenylyltransferase [Candidatus Eisenbacteria bacterium]|jgi:pantetheine-phosphate adenylyltransferase|nr:pantetheine-phosphate adenylyltransferase [Candidatus Eisenbacteria bacterium]